MAPTATMAMLLLACVCWPVAGDAPMALLWLLAGLTASGLLLACWW